jgi:hypothetical protein
MIPDKPVAALIQNLLRLDTSSRVAPAINAPTLPEQGFQALSARIVNLV